MKFLIKDIGRDEFRLVDEEKSVVVPVIRDRYHRFDVAILLLYWSAKVTIEDTAAYEAWNNQM
jgi:hypothetical protein